MMNILVKLLGATCALMLVVCAHAGKGDVMGSICRL